MKSINSRSVRKHINSVLIAFALIPITAFSVHATPVTVQNPSFETLGTEFDSNPNDNAQEWYSMPAGGPWVTTNTALDPNATTDQFALYNVPQQPPFEPGFFNQAADGNVFVNLGGLGILSQDLNFQVTAGQAISLNFNIGETQPIHINGSTPPDEVLGAGTLQAQILVNGVPIATQAFSSTAGEGNWQLTTLTGTVITGGDLSIAFTDLGNDTPYLDNVSVDAAAVPEPSTYALLSAGVMALWLGTRRRMTKSFIG